VILTSRATLADISGEMIAQPLMTGLSFVLIRKRVIMYVEIY